MHKDTVTRSRGPLSCHSSASMSSCFQHDNERPRGSICIQFLDAENVPVLLGLYTHHTSPIEHVWDALDKRVVQTTLHSHWRGVGQHSTCQNQQPDQLYAKEICRVPWGKCWSPQLPTGFPFLFSVVIIASPTFGRLSCFLQYFMAMGMVVHAVVTMCHCSNVAIRP